MAIALFYQEASTPGIIRERFNVVQIETKRGGLNMGVSNVSFQQAERETCQNENSPAATTRRLF